ncbi:MAG: GtrA family protein [Rikenellaceae bacterium]|nr:GtrA family protein [Rikenellaceae bacterium]
MRKFFRNITACIDFFYAGPVKRLLPRQTFRYAASGGINMILDTLLYYLIFHYILCERFIDLGIVVVSPYIAALCIVFPITFFNGFLLNRYVAFQMSPLRGRIQLGRYALSVAGSLLINYALMKLFVEAFHIFPTPSKFITNILVAIYSYLMQKYFSFRGCTD